MVEAYRGIWCMSFVTLASHLPMLLPMRMLINRGWVFESCLSFFSFLGSFMYHISESLQTNELFLSELQWHRLDNIGVLCLFGCFYTYLCIIPNPNLDLTVKMMCMILAILVQEYAPWNVVFTAAPVVLFMMMPVAVFGLYHQRKPAYDWKMFFRGFGLLGLAGPFFILGLDDHNDPCRLFHAMWHVIGSLASMYLWCIVKNPTQTHIQMHQQSLPPMKAPYDSV